MVWAQNYVDAVVQRDVREVFDVDRLDRMPPLLQAIALHSAQLANMSTLGAAVGLDHKTAGKYVGLFEQLFLTHRLPA